MRMLRLSCLALAVLTCGCAPTPSWYGVPAQHKPVGDPAAVIPSLAPVGEYMCAADPNADLYIVRDVKGLENNWRWTHANPELRFRLKPGAAARTLHVELGVNDRTFAETGPLKLIVEVNGRELTRTTLAQFGDHTIDQPVESTMLVPGAENLLRIRVLNPWQAPDPGVQLGFVLKCAGFK